jgi:lysophospholipase L1-like esterase
MPERSDGSAIDMPAKPAPSRGTDWAVASTLLWFLVFWVCYSDDGVTALADRIARKPDHRASPPALPGTAPPQLASSDDDAEVVDDGEVGEDPDAATRAAAKAAHVEDTCIDGTPDACRRWAMDGFYAAVAAARSPHPDHPVRVSYYGDSVTGTDVVPARVRRRLQAELGDGGPGFIWAARPHRFVYHQVVSITTSGGWTIWTAPLAPVGDGLHGVGGSSAQTIGGTTSLSSKTPFTEAEVYYLVQPGGGTADIAIDGTVRATIDTAGDVKDARFERVRVDTPSTRFKLKARGKVRLFGIVLENAAGAVVDNMGLVSATVKNLLNNRADHFRDQLAHRGADLVIVMLGANEAAWIPASKKALAEYQGRYETILAPIRAGRPDGACLVVSTLDQAHVNDAGDLVSRPVMPRMVAAQKAAAVAQGCAFFSAYAWQGGKGSALKWRRRGWTGDDFQHLSQEAADKLADAIVGDLLAGARDYELRAAAGP